ncbi:cell wall hydrolase [Alteriqipengyuania sp.]|uniref:cell wall hydrolase n=1 Tax=Alteriqipengyuania sp. TaxID=2800692 RepID=UPI0035142C47
MTTFRHPSPSGKRPASPFKAGRALLVLGAAVTIPAMAAQAEWRLPEVAPQASEIVAGNLVEPLAFEKAGATFPGSALYFLADPPAAATTVNVSIEGGTGVNPIAAWNGDPDAAIAIETAGPAARGFVSRGTGLDKARALDCLAKAVYYEAASESVGGQQAVAQVVLNRVAHPAYPKTVCGVVYQGSQRRTGCQFSFTCDGSMARKPSATYWARALSVARRALAGEVYAPVGLATHYHTTWVNPYWAPSLAHIGTIGAHRFYRWPGAASRPAAFSDVYNGGEPLPAPAPAARSAQPAPDPVAIARQYESAPATSQNVQPGYEAQARPGAGAPARAQPFRQEAPAPVEGPGSVRPEYANSGQWIARPN